MIIRTNNNTNGMKAIVTASFEIDVTDWYKGERLTKKEKFEKVKEELADFSVFMPLAEYSNFKDVEVVIKEL